MSIGGSAYILESQSQTDTNSVWYARPQSRPEKGNPWVGIPGSSLVGDHGPEYTCQKPSPADFSAVLNCGCTLRFPMPTSPGEMLFCRLHDDWYKSQPVEVKKESPEVSYTIKCPVCPEWSAIHFDSGPAYTKARKHAIGSKGGRINNPHPVLFGKTVNGETTWKNYSYKGRE